MTVHVLRTYSCSESESKSDHFPIKVGRREIGKGGERGEGRTG